MQRFITLGLIVALSSCNDATQPTPEAVATAEVRVVDNSFAPAANRVDIDESVTWTWSGSNPHNVTFDGQSIGNSDTQTAGTFSKSFATSGEYTYYCTVHGRSVMSGSVVVGDANGRNPGGY